MNKKARYASVALTLLLTCMIAGCSSSGDLRKFKDSDLTQEISPELAKKFEIKDVDATTPTPTPAEKTARHPVKKTVKKIARKKHVRKKHEKGADVNHEAVVPPMRRPDPMPFDVGEKLRYGIRYIGVTAAHFTMEVLPFKEVNDRKVYHLRGQAKTVSLFELIYRVNDVIESYWDYDGLYSTRFTMELDESKQSRKVIELYDYDKKKSYYWNRVDHSEKGYSEQKEQYDIPLWSQDPISALYYVRTLKLPTEPGKEARFPVILDGKPWESVFRYLGQEKIYAGDQYYEADKYQLENYQNGQAKNKDNTLWLSRDAHRYVLRLEAKVKVGSFAIALDKIL